MKKLKFLLCAFGLCALFMVSCGNENEPTNPGGGGIVPPVHTDPSMLVTSMIGYEKYVIGYEKDYCDLTYDSNNRLAYVKGMNEDMNYYYEFSYSPLSFIYGYDNDIVEYDLKVNDDGYITYLKDEDRIVTYEYKDGYLVKSVLNNFDLLYTWENGNLMKIIIDFRDGKIYGEHKYSYTEKSTDNTGVYFPHKFEQDFMLLMGGFLGKTSVKIPVSVEITYSWDVGQTIKNNISVEYDSKGRIIKEFYNDELVRVYAYEGNKAVGPEN